MKKATCTQLFENYLNEVSCGRGGREHENPINRFTQNAKNGDYNQISDEDYYLLRQEMKDISDLFWLNADQQQAADILRLSLENINIDEQSCHKIAEILAECYSASVHSDTPEDAAQTPDDEDATLVFDDCLSKLLFPRKNITEFGDNQDSNYEDYFGCEFDDSISSSDSKSQTNKVQNSPTAINNWLSERIYGQKDAVMAASMLLYNSARGIKRNILFAGPTGCGKTEIWRVCQKLYHNIRIIDSTQLTGDGWKGSYKVSNIFDGMDLKEAENSIIVFDEFDKLCEPKIGNNDTNYSLIVQNELLKLIEGTTLNLKNYQLDTSKISFVFCGSFEQLTEMKTDTEKQTSIGFGARLEKAEAQSIYENELQPSDLVKYAGVRQEIAGRINQIVRLTPMTADGYRAILQNEQMSPLHQLELQYGVKLKMDEATEERLVQEAAETRMGVRYLRSRIQQMLDVQLFSDCNRKEYLLSA